MIVFTESPVISIKSIPELKTETTEPAGLQSFL